MQQSYSITISVGAFAIGQKDVRKPASCDPNARRRATAFDSTNGAICTFVSSLIVLTIRRIIPRHLLGIPSPKLCSLLGHLPPPRRISEICHESVSHYRTVNKADHGLRLLYSKSYTALQVAFVKHRLMRFLMQRSLLRGVNVG